MAYTPDAKTQAALKKARSGGTLSLAEQSLLAQHSKRMIDDMAPKVGTGGPYDYGSGTIGGGYSNYGQNQPFDTNSGLAYLNPNELAQGYQNFLDTEQQRRSQGLAPRPLPVQFTQFAAQNNPLGYDLSSGQYTPKQGSQGYNDMVKAGIITTQGAPVTGQPADMGPYQYNPVSTPANGTPTPQVNPSITPTPVTTNPTATLPFNPAAALPSAPQTIHTPNGGLELGNSVGGIDEGKLLAEAELQKQLRTQTYDQQVAGRQAMLNDLSQTLQKQQMAMLNDQMPGIYEDLNTRGLLRSSALGEKVGLEASKLARQTSEQLALQGIQDRNTAINDLSGIEDSYLAGRGSAMQRRFSLEDFDRQIAAGKSLGANALPQISQPSAKGSSALQGGLGGATVGGQVGGPTGAVIGGTLGALTGGQLGGK